MGPRGCLFVSSQFLATNGRPADHFTPLHIQAAALQKRQQLKQRHVVPGRSVRTLRGTPPRNARRRSAAPVEQVPRRGRGLAAKAVALAARRRAPLPTTGLGPKASHPVNRCGQGQGAPTDRVQVKCFCPDERSQTSFPSQNPPKIPAPLDSRNRRSPADTAIPGGGRVPGGDARSGGGFLCKKGAAAGAGGGVGKGWDGGEVVSFGSRAAAARGRRRGGGALLAARAAAPGERERRTAPGKPSVGRTPDARRAQVPGRR